MAIIWGNRVGANEQRIGVEVTETYPTIEWDTEEVVVAISVWTQQNKSHDGDTQRAYLTIDGVTTNQSFLMSGDAGYLMSPMDGFSQPISLISPEAQPLYVNAYITGHYSGVSPTVSTTFMIGPPPNKPVNVDLVNPTTLAALTTFNMGTTVRIRTNRVSTAYTTNLKWNLNGYSGTIANGVGAYYDWTFPAATLASAIPTTSSGNGYITYDVYEGAVLVASYTSSGEGNFTASLPSSYVPAISTVTTKETVSAVGTMFGVALSTPTTTFVQGNSKMLVQMSGATASLGATIKNYSINYDGVTNPGSSWTSGVLTKTGTAMPVTATVTDSRGRTASKTVTGGVTVLAWSPPTISAFTVARTDAAGIPQQLGAYVKPTVLTGMSSLKKSTTEYNRLNYVIRSRPKVPPGSAWTDRYSTAQTTNLTQNYSPAGPIPPTTGSPYSSDLAWEFEIQVYDKLSSDTKIASVGVGFVTMCWNKLGVGIGKVWTAGALDVRGDVNIADGTTGFTGTNINVTGGTTTFDGSTVAITNNGTLTLNGQPIQEAKYIGAGVDLDTLTTTGYYVQSASANATSALNYPEGYAGMLRVVSRQSGSMVWQEYTTYGSTNRTYKRGYYNGTWNVWRLINLRGKASMTRSSTLSLTAGTWTNVTFDTASSYNFGITATPASGTFTIPSTGEYDIFFHQRWQYFGSSNYRGAAIVLGTSAPSSANIIGLSTSDSPDFLHRQTTASDIHLTASDVVSFWAISETATSSPGFFNAVSGTNYPLFPMPDTYATIRHV